MIVEHLEDRAIIHVPSVNGTTKIEIDKEDIALLDTCTRWRITPEGYLYGDYTTNGTVRRVPFHRLVVGAEEGQIVDHIDCDKKNNKRANLRIVTKQQNVWNRPAVGYYKLKNGKYHVRIKKDGMMMSCGSYHCEEDAKTIRKLAEKYFFGPYAFIGSLAQPVDDFSDAESAC